MVAEIHEFCEYIGSGVLCVYWIKTAMRTSDREFSVYVGSIVLFVSRIEFCE